MGLAAIPGREQARTLYIKGLGPKDIASKLDIPIVTVRKWITRLKWGRERHAIDALAANPAQVIQSLAADRFVARVLAQAEKLLIALEVGLSPDSPRDIKDCAIALASISATGRKALGLDNDSGPRSVSILVLADDAKRARIIDADAQVQVQPEPPAQPTSSDQS